MYNARRRPISLGVRWPIGGDRGPIPVGPRDWPLERPRKSFVVNDLRGERSWRSVQPSSRGPAAARGGAKILLDKRRSTEIDSKSSLRRTR